MVKVMRLAVVLLTIVGVVGFTIPAYCQEKIEQQATTSVSGEIVSVDLVKLTIVVKHLKDPITNTYEDITISVLPETELVKRDVALTFSDLKVGDKVIIESISDVSGESKVVSITVETEEVAPVK